jgi:hypothetical protein
MKLLTAAEVYHDAMPTPVSFQYPTADRECHARADGFGGAGFETFVIWLRIIFRASRASGQD